MRVLTRAAASALTALLAFGGIVAVGAAPALAATAATSGSVTTSDPQVGRYCETGELSHADTIPITVDVSGTYDIAMTAMSGGDLMYSLMSGSTCVAFNDDSGGTLAPRVVTALTAGVPYRLVITNYYAPSTASTSWTTTVSGPGTPVFAHGASSTLAQAAGQADPAATGPVRFVASFSAPVTGFDASDVIVGTAPAGSTVAVTGGPSVYGIEVSGMQASGDIVLSLRAAAATTVATGAPTQPTVVVDGRVRYAPAPTVTVEQASGQVDPTGTLPVSFDVRFSESVTGFAPGDVVVSGSAGGSAVTVAGSGASYAVQVTDAQLPGTIAISLPAGTASSVFGVPSQASTSNDATVTFLPSPPTVVVTPATGTSTTVPIAFGVEFSGPVQGFDAADVVLGGTAGASGVTVTGSGASYVATVADAQRAGTVTAQVVALAATRYGLANGASNVASTTFAPPRPSATVEQSAAQSDPTPDPVATFDVTFSEPVTGLDAADLVVGGTAGATQVSLSGSGAAYVATVTGAVRPGTITLALGEAAATSRFGEASLAATSTDAEVSFDPGTPALAIERASGQDAITTSDEVAFAATFSQPVTGFDVDDVVLGGTTGGTVTVTGSGADYAIVVSGLERAGEVSVSVPAEAATSAYGVPSAAATTTDATVAFVPERPSATVEQGAEQADPADVDGFVFDVVFSQPVTGFEAADVVVAGTSGATVVELTGDGAAYVVAVSGATQPGTVSVSIPEGAATGAYETTSLASTSTDAEVTFAPPAPTVTVEQAPSQADPTDFGFIAFDVTFSHDVTGLAAESFVVGGTAGATSVLLEGSGSSYRAYVADMTQPGTVTLALAEGAAVDRYGLVSLASTSVDAEVTFAPPAPTATITRAQGQAAVANAEPFVFDVAFSVPVSGFDADDVVVEGDTGATIVEVVPAPQSGGDAAATAAVDAPAADLGYDWTVRVSGATSYGVVAIGIREGAVTSGYGLANAAIEASVDGTVVYAPAVVAPAPVAPAPVAPAPVAPAPVAALPQTGGEPLWGSALVALLVLAAGTAVRRRARRG